MRHRSDERKTSEAGQLIRSQPRLRARARPSAAHGFADRFKLATVDWYSGLAREAGSFLARHGKPDVDPGDFAYAWRRIERYCNELRQPLAVFKSAVPKPSLKRS